MPPARRWIRLDVDWDGSGWLVRLHGLAQLAWVRLLCHTKKSGARGRTKALDPAAAAVLWRIPEKYVVAMITAAVDDGALEVVDGEWTIPKWPEYQETDRTAADRMKKYRNEKSRLSPLRRNDRNTPSQPVTASVTRHATETETELQEPPSSLRSEAPPNGSAKKRRQALPRTWTPNPKHSLMAAELAVDLKREAANFRDHADATGRLMLDWDAAFRTWLRNAPQYANGHGRSPPDRVKSPTLDLRTVD